MKRTSPPFIADLAPLWVGGLAVLQIYLVNWTLPLEGESLEWAQYLLLGTAFPLLVLLLRPPLSTQALLGLACFLPVLLLLLGPGWRLCVLLGTGQLLLLLVLLRLHSSSEGVAQFYPVRLSGLVFGIALASLGWLVGIHWVWYYNFPIWLIESYYTLAVGLAALLLATAAVAGLCLPRAPVSRWLGWCMNALALGLFAFLSLHVCGLGMRDPPGATEFSDFLGRRVFHHWGAILEPADLVRQGEWLLWDVPTQYGFVNTLIVAALPFATVWQSLYVCHAVLQTVAAGIIFWLFWSLRPGLTQFCFALLMTTVAVFLIPSETIKLSGPHPSVGAFRFLWCYILLGILAWDYESLRAGMLNRRSTLILGSLAWLAGTLWSAESGIFCTTIWVPSYTLLVLRRRVALPGRWRVLAAWLALPPLLLAAAVAVICSVYVLALGEMPDGRCFIEYCVAVQFFALPINPSGTVGVLMLAFVVIATIGAYCLREADPLQALPLVVGAAAALWAVSSYFIGRSHDNTAINLTSVMVCSLAAVLRVLDRAQPNEPWPSWIKVSLMPLFTVLLAMPFVDSNVVAQYVRDTAKGYHPDVTLSLPDIDPDLQELLTETKVDADTPIAFFDNDAAFTCPFARWQPHGSLGPIVGARAWLPAGSTVLYTPLSIERRHIYFSRFIARTQRSGWLIRANNEPLPELAWILEEVKKTHTPGVNMNNAKWTMAWYEYRAMD